MYLCELIDGLTAHMGEEAANCDLKIRRCSKSNIYVLQPIRYCMNECQIVFEI